ncbi:hypothetical protein WH96_06400 [Kiloniella spongiae]|uniref:Lipoprotein n=1 Tax=Kiloniella spongiae TaxID=1489064 RepID=A0A0H2MHT3_9PROT|nr:hypothetical protein [Kiloniella spongiae]KLN61903.1 hypothetical protein WH96_06400 [Kiloniella spongiae]
MKDILMTVAFVAAFFMSACTTPGGNRLSAEQQVQITCEGIISTVRVLAGYRAAGELSKETVKTVSDLMPSTVKLCSGEVTDYASTLTTLQETAFILLTVKKGVES